MAEYSSGEVAQMLGIAPMTLRRWCLELAAWLTPSAAGAAPLGEAGEPRYSEDDVWVLQHAAPLLRESRDYAQIRARLAAIFPLDLAQERAVGVGEASESAMPAAADVAEPATAAPEEIGPEPSTEEPSVVDAEVIEPEPRVPPDIAGLLERMAELYKQLLANKEQEIAALRQALDATELAAAVERRELEMLTRITRILERENQRLGAELEAAQQQLALLPIRRPTWRKRMSRWFGRGESEAHSTPPDLFA